MSHHRYTVVIPTRNRQHYCVEAVQTALLAEREDVQIIVLDNSDDETLRGRLEDANILNRVEYVSPIAGETLPMHQNWERAIDRIQGRWVTFIGDDDGCLPHMFDVLDFIDGHFTFEAITWNAAYYKWPCYPAVGKGEFCYPPDMNINIALQLTKHELERAAHWNTEEKYPSFGPSVYHGAVRTELVQRAKQQFGQYFHHPIPDYVSGFNNLTMIDMYGWYNQPLTIYGAGQLSNTAAISGIRTKTQQEDLTTFLESVADNDAYGDLPGSQLGTPHLVAFYRESFARLGTAFHITPKHILNSCLMELQKVRCETQFAQERAILVAYAKQHGLPHESVEALTAKSGKHFVGLAPQGNYIHVDTTELGVTGILDLVKSIKAFMLTFEHTKQYHEIFYERFKQAVPAEFQHLVLEAA